MTIYREPVRWMIEHPKKGVAYAEERSKLEALLAAALVLDLTAEEQEECKVYLHNADRDKPRFRPEAPDS